MTRAEGERGAPSSTKLAFTHPQLRSGGHSKRKARRQVEDPTRVFDLGTRFIRAVARTGNVQAGSKAAGVSWDRYLHHLRGRLHARACEGHAPSLRLLFSLSKAERDNAYWRFESAIARARSAAMKEVARGAQART